MRKSPSRLGENVDVKLMRALRVGFELTLRDGKATVSAAELELAYCEPPTRPYKRCLSLMIWSMRPNQASVLVIVLPARKKLLAFEKPWPGRFWSPQSGITFAEIGWMRSAGILSPGNASRMKLPGLFGSARVVSGS